MNFLILDIYKNDNWRLVKDTAGGYGTGNDFGNSIISRLINSLVSKMINMPPMYSMYIYSILKKKFGSYLFQELQHKRFRKCGLYNNNFIYYLP